MRVIFEDMKAVVEGEMAGACCGYLGRWKWAPEPWGRSRCPHPPEIVHLCARCDDEKESVCR